MLDAAIIAQYQRMTHYGITGFGTVAAFAKALKLEDDRSKLEAAVKDMHGSDALLLQQCCDEGGVPAGDRRRLGDRDDPASRRRRRPGLRIRATSSPWSRRRRRAVWRL